MPQLSIANNTQKIHYFEEPLHRNSQFLVKPINMVLILGGTFQMGSPATEIGRSEREDPQHFVTVPSFFVSQYLIPQVYWLVVADTMPQVNIPLEKAPSTLSLKGEDRTIHPVTEVNWFEAVEFCERLSKHSGRTYRLPTEAEWEYACRAGTTTPYHFGEVITTDLVNYSGTENESSEFMFQKATTPVNAFPPNAFGLYNMHGNVSEWCLDHWHDNYEEAPSDGSHWIDLNDINLRVVRGGCKHNLARNCRSATRSFDVCTYKGNDIGFRVVCEIPTML